MNEEMEKVLLTLTRLTDKIKSGEMPLSTVPITSLKGILVNWLKYGDEDALIGQIADDWGNNLYNLTGGEQGDKELFAKIICLTVECMRLWSEREAHYNRHLNHMLNIANNNNAFALDNYLYGEITKLYKQDRLDGAYVERSTYRSLASVIKKNEVSLFKDIADRVFQINIERIKKQKKVTVAFFLYHDMKWSCEAIYKKLAENPEFDVFIAAAPHYAHPHWLWDDYKSCLEYFRGRGFKIVGMYDLTHGRYLSWEEIGTPDIIFNLDPYHMAFTESANMENFPLSALNIYIPYGIGNGTMPHPEHNQLSHKLCWKIFCESPAHKEMAKKYSDIGGDNVVSSGYVKMDDFFIGQAIDTNLIWKVKTGADEKKVKKIIYAPHYSIKDGLGIVKFGNFDKIYMDIYEYAKRHSETTSWILRPHPSLAAMCIRYGVFKNGQQYADYLKKWDELPNAKVSDSGKCTDIFMSSDAMILDSSSFVSEYLYAHKPALFLTRKSQMYNDYGEEVINVLYHADGGDFPAVVDFIENVVISGNDPMKNIREEFFDKHLNYVKYNGKLASDFIYDYLLDTVRA